MIGLAPVVAAACLYVLSLFRGPGPWIRDLHLCFPSLSDNVSALRSRAF